MRDGRRVGPPASLAESAARFAADVTVLPAAARAVHGVAPEVRVSERLAGLTAKLSEERS